MVPESLVASWEAAYRRYTTASELAAAAAPGDPHTARIVAATSQELATLWHNLSTTPNLPWWIVAAVSAAAESFHHQARAWTPPPDPRPRPGIEPRPGPDSPTAPTQLLPTAPDPQTAPFRAPDPVTQPTPTLA